MFAFIKKLFGFKSVVAEPAAPYKVEAPATVEPQITDAVTVKPVAPADKASRPAQPKQGQQKKQGQKPAGQKPATKKPAQGTGSKQNNGKPRGRRPKAKSTGQ